MNTATPGPWTIAYDARNGIGGYMIVGAVEPNQADARLIAAAPDLLDALKSIVDIGEQMTPEKLLTSRAAIAKAEGRS